MYPGFLSTAFSHRCDTAVLLNLGGVLETLPVFPEGGEKPGCEDEAGAWQGSENRVVRELGYELCDSLIELTYEFQGGSQLFGQGQGFQGTGVDDGGVVSQCGGRLYRLNAGFDLGRRTR